MPFSLLNGLSGMGAGVAQFAATAGLEEQKADLAMQQTKLADQLATNREVNVVEPYQTSQNALNRQNAVDLANVTGGYQVQSAQIGAASRVSAAQAEAGGMMGAAAINEKAAMANVQAQIAANAPEVQARVALVDAQVKQLGVQTPVLQASSDLTMQILQENQKTDPDTDKLNSLYQQREALMAPADRAKILGQSVDMAKNASSNAAMLDLRVGQMTQQLNALTMNDKGRPEQEQALQSVKAQLNAALQQSIYYGQVVRSYTRMPGTPGGAAPPLAATAKATDFLPKPAPAPGAAPAPDAGTINAAPPMPSPF